MADLPELVERRLREVQAELHAADALTRLSPELQVLLELEEPVVAWDAITRLQIIPAVQAE
jgi:hypothetical protein